MLRRKKKSKTCVTPGLHVIECSLSWPIRSSLARAIFGTEYSAHCRKERQRNFKNIRDLVNVSQNKSRCCLSQNNVFLDRLQSTSNVFKRGKYQDYMKVKIVAHTSEDDISNCSVLRLISGRISFEVARFSQTESICCKLSHFPSKLMYKKAEIFSGLEIPTDSSKRSFESHTSINFRAKTTYTHITTPQSIHFACQKYCCCL